MAAREVFTSFPAGQVLAPHPARFQEVEMAAGVKGTMEHGTWSMYTGGRCRCEPCTAAASAYQRDRKLRIKTGELKRRRRNTSPSVCGVCQQPIVTHPIRACWRLVG